MKLAVGAERNLRPTQLALTQVNMLRFSLLFAALVTLAGCGPAQPASSAGGDPNQKVTLALNWFPDAQHGGFYAAAAEGYFAEEGLDVTIVPGGSKVPVIQNVAGGQATFGIATADQIVQGRAAGANVVAVMAAMQESPRCILVHEESGITSLAELKNVTLAVRPGITFYEYLKTKAPLTDVKIVPYTGTVTQFLLDKNYAQQAFVFSEPHVAELQGAKVRSLMVSDVGYNPYSSVLFTSDSVAQSDPKLITKMRRACVRGWQKYLEDPASANELIRAANPEMTAEALAYGATAIKPLCLPEGTDAKDFGKMTVARWQELTDQLVELKLIEPKAVKAVETMVPED